MQLLYHHPSLGYRINFTLKRLEILHTDPKELRRSSDIDVFLNSFCLWQRKFNPIADDDIVHFDHAVILTGLDLYVVSKKGKVSSQVVGLAPVAGMCTTTSSCTINEGKHFESVFVVAHEIGHKWVCVRFLMLTCFQNAFRWQFGHATRYIREQLWSKFVHHVADVGQRENHLVKVQSKLFKVIFGVSIPDFYR